MAPETALRQESDKGSDVYSLGLILYEMLTGVHPFKDVVADLGQTAEQRIRQIMQRRIDIVVKPPSAHNRGVEDWLDDIVLDCLEPCPIDKPSGGPSQPEKGPLGQLFANLLNRRREKVGGARRRPKDARELLNRLSERRKPPKPLPKDLEEREQCLRRKIEGLKKGNRDWLEATMELIKCLIKQDKRGVRNKAGQVLETVRKMGSREDILNILKDREELALHYKRLAKLYESSKSLKIHAATYKTKAEQERNRNNLHIG